MAGDSNDCCSRLFLHVLRIRPIHLFNRSIWAILIANVFCHLAPMHQMVHTGVKVFERNSSARSVLDFRVCQEGLDLVLPYMTRRVTR